MSPETIKETIRERYAPRQIRIETIGGEVQLRILDPEVSAKEVSGALRRGWDATVSWMDSLKVTIHEP